MAFKFKNLIAPNQGPHYRNVKAYICDTPDDINKLPRVGVKGTQVLNDGEDDIDNAECNYGSEATVVSPFGGFVLNASNQWKQIF